MENNNKRRWGLTEWILLGSIVLMILFALAYFIFDIPIVFIPIIFAFPFMGNLFKKKSDQ